MTNLYDWSQHEAPESRMSFTTPDAIALAAIPLFDENGLPETGQVAGVLDRRDNRFAVPTMSFDEPPECVPLTRAERFRYAGYGAAWVGVTAANIIVIPKIW